MYAQKHSSRLLIKSRLNNFKAEFEQYEKDLAQWKKKMVKDNFYIVHIIKERGVCPDISLFLLQVKMKGRETSYSEAEIV